MKKNLLLLFLFGCSYVAFPQEPWEMIFNGKNLQGWTQLGGTATYEVVNGEIVGTATPHTPNSFLVTEKTYEDFILEYEIFIDSELNSGVQIRSNADPSYKKGVVYGYQVELDPSPRAFSGGIYDEQRRGWLYPLSRNLKASTALKFGRWNHFRVECKGNSIQTWINGIQCARIVDDLTSSGFIGLQVHSIGSNDVLQGAQIKWKNVRVITEDVDAYAWDSDPEVDEISFLHNELTAWERDHGWRLLWDGKSSDGWKGAKLNTFPKSGWEMKDGILTVIGTDGGESTGPGDIITTKNYSNFELVLDFKITEGANSGIKYFVDPGLNKGSGSAIGLEFQILDDRNHPDAKMGVNGNRTVGSLYDLITAGNLSVPGRGKQFKYYDWNRARIVSNQGVVEHWLNGEKVVEFDRWSQMFEALVAYSKYAKWPHFGRWDEGPILLQDHGNTVHFKNIKIREY